jgi:tRNA-dihydrouridine synthase
MMDWTGRHCRYFMRPLSPSAFLYTEMVTAAVNHHGDAERFLKFNDEEHPLFASHPLITSQVLGIVYRVIATHLVKKAGYSKKAARTGAVKLIQRFGRSGAPGALNLNPNAARFIFTC